MAGILDMAALGASEAPADLAFNLKGALQPAVRDDDVEYEGMCRCLVEMLLIYVLYEYCTETGLARDV